MYKRIPILVKSLLSMLFCAFLAISVSAKSSQTTIDNLNKALKGETNASHKYELFATKAETQHEKLYEDALKILGKINQLTIV